jgi:Cu/Ag efflux protein CusF
MNPRLALGAVMLMFVAVLPTNGNAVAFHGGTAGRAPPLVQRAQETAASGVFHGVGVVTAIQPKTGALTLDHEDIKGFMPAMEMMYNVESPSVSEGLAVGDRVRFDIDAKSYTILGVERLEPPK